MKVWRLKCISCNRVTNVVAATLEEAVKRYEAKGWTRVGNGAVCGDCHG